MKLEILIKADGNGEPHTLIIQDDPYGVTVRDKAGGPAVALDWNGKELKAIVYRSRCIDGEPSIIEAWRKPI
jgi:hypothetical protein